MPRAVAQRGQPRNLLQSLQDHAIAGGVAAATGLAQQHATNIGVNLVERLNEGVQSAGELFRSYGLELPQGPAANTRSAVKRAGEASELSTPPKKNPPQNQQAPATAAPTDAPTDAPMDTAAATSGPSTTSTEFSNVEVVGPCIDHPTTTRVTFRKQRRFTLNIDGPSNAAFPPLKWDGSTFYCENDWNIIPWKSSSFYMSGSEICELHAAASKFRVVDMGYKMTNFTAHSGNKGGTGPNLNMHYGGIGFDSVVIGQRELGTHSIRDITKDGNPQEYHDGVAIKMTECGYSEYPWHLRYYADGVVRTPGGNTLVEIRRLEKYATFQLGSPAVTQGRFTPPEKKWFTTVGLRGRAQVVEVGLSKTMSALGTLANVWPFTTDELSNQALGHSSTGTQIVCPNDGDRTLWQYLHFNTCQSEAAPMSWFRNGQNSADHITYPGMTVGAQGNGTFMDTPVVAFRPVVPPTPDLSDPNIMVSFVLESDMTIEYVPLLGDGTLSFGQSHCNYKITQDDMTVIPDVSGQTMMMDSYWAMRIENSKGGTSGIRTDKWKDVPLHDQGATTLVYNGPLGNDIVSNTHDDQGYTTQGGFPV